MSRPRYDWWQTVRAYVRAYPGNCARIRELEQVSMTAACSGMPGGGGVARTTEQVALRALSTWERTGYDAVQGAIREVLRRDSCWAVLSMVDLVYWRKTDTFAGVALKLNYSERQIRRMNMDFLRLVGVHAGYLSREEYQRWRRERR